MSKNYDLHCHSVYSDGRLTPSDLLARASECGVDVLSLTDHDTLMGYEALYEVSNQYDIEIIPGIEFSSQWQGIGVHIVGLNVDIENEGLQQAIARQEVSRSDRAVEIGRRLEKIGVKDALAGAKAIAGDGVVGRPHFARYLVEIGEVANFNQAFKRYLGAGKPGDVKQNWPEIEEVVKWIVEGGGSAVLAHPAKYSMTRSKLCRLVADFTEAGGVAMEVISGKQTEAQTLDLVKIANKFGLASSCGSDFHTPGAPWQELGSFGRLPPAAMPVWSLW